MPLPSCMTSGTFLHFPVPQFPHLNNAENNNTHFVRCSKDLMKPWHFKKISYCYNLDNILNASRDTQRVNIEQQMCCVSIEMRAHRYTPVQKHIQTHASAYAHNSMCTHAHAYAHLHTYMHACACTHTHTQLQLPFSGYR